jgi:molybdate transport system substrate-binding protein
MLKRFMVLAVLLPFVIGVQTLPAQEKIRCAVAANYIQAFTEIAAAFEAKTGVKVEGTFSSSGNLYSQIVNGAPYDLFLSADEERPARLLKEGFAERPFVYARGRVVLWSAKKDFCTKSGWQEALKGAEVKKIALANPVTAPYGTAAQAAMQKTGLWSSLKDKCVQSQDIAQAFQYAATQSVDAGFCAFSSAVSPEGRKGCYYAVPEAPDIVQSACIVSRTKNRAAAERFAAFLQSSEAFAVKEKLGYK